ncbi:fumarylacetoacetate hydrolase family protein [Rhodopila sp.]|jgi:2-keto-4-pentenoate hydratase/2-oxohepta-3-ene-1,7-dioic acid hydratase in catechol pathway|uniref:fumarylacetoacetate hydrolase family protein n=1 Tax=Rhodopila sp. TaxID=2480087 RepID=UPI002C33B409|nr:fumarylacetoacetate hydrolase family protein [Rhodopila sp.]HVZ08026.1 fumarylacetoacetate hydrolase family protein [Rhodopila sp.]
MRYVRFTRDGVTRYGLVDGDMVRPIAGEPWTDPTPSGDAVALSAVTLEVPVIPRTFYAAGINYAAHIREMAAKRGETPKFPEKADIGYRANNALVAHDQDVVIPAHATTKINYEGELVVVIGKQAKHLTEAEAMSCVFGYTIGNDVSERTWQRGDRTFWRGKNTDTFKPMGPWIQTQADLDAMETIVRVNGKEDLRFKTNDMIFGIAHYISQMTRYLTLYPGDVIWMGTDGTSPDLVHGDVVEVELTGLGVLRNRFVREGA